MKSKKKNKKIVTLAVWILIILFAVVFVIKYNEINNLKKAIEYVDCTYIGISNSKEKEYDKDLFITIPYKPVESSVTTNQAYYEKMIRIIYSQMKQKSFRIIDEKNDLIIQIKADGDNLKYTINGDNNYYATSLSKISNSNNEEKLIQLNVESQELNSLIQNNWDLSKVKGILGTKDKDSENYECYVDEGYNIRTVNLKVFNIVFTNNYKSEIFDGITTGLDNYEIVSKLGEPILQSDTKPEIGYKTKDYYVFFYDGEVSIYRIDEIDNNKNDEFANLVTKLIEDKEFNEFIDKLTDLYPDFDKYSKSEDKIDIVYSLRGFGVTYSKNGQQGITIYNNYQGKITNDININEIGKTKALPFGLHYYDIDSVYQSELKRGKY